MHKLDSIRQHLRAATLSNERDVVQHMVDHIQSPVEQRQQIVDRAAAWVRELRDSSTPGLMESFLAEYGLSTQEGVALMCMAEAYLRVPDSETLDELIQDKISPQDFAEHLGHSSSMMVNASTWGLMLTGSVLSESDQRGLIPALHGLVRRAGEPIIRAAVKQMMRMMGGQFVLGETISDAIDNGKNYQKKGYRYSFDMLGEAAHTQADADRYYLAYADAITELSPYCDGRDVRHNPGISVKLSALYPRYESLQREAVLDNLFPAIRSLCLLAKKAGIGLNIDAEEVERLDLSLDIIAALVADSSLQGWQGLGVVVQAYSYRAPHVLDWLYALAEQHDTRLMVRLVKGAYWDREIKRSQELGLEAYPVYTRKNNTDLSYWYCARKLLNQRDRIFPQFATHNAHTMAAIIEMTAHEQEDPQDRSFEFQRLHGMGEALHELVREKQGLPCRIYAPVGVHQDLLAYLVRRLLENGANASFVSQLLDKHIPPRVVTADPVDNAIEWLQQAIPGVPAPGTLFKPERENSKGFDFQELAEIEQLEQRRKPYQDTQWHAHPLVAEGVPEATDTATLEITNPATGTVLGSVTEASPDQLDSAMAAAREAQTEWQAMGVGQRARILNRAADLYEAHSDELFALACREAGKIIQDGIAELREAVDFLRYYAAQAEHIPPSKQACGVMACISPWNFPLAIFTGQLSAALAAGNAVLVKPAESTPLIAFRAVQLLHEAGVPTAICQFLPGSGRTLGAAMSAHPQLNGLIFTGSTATARHIEAAMSEQGDVDAPFIAETGGLNAMIIDSTALPEQAVTDIINSAFQSAGQRCSALRILYLQEDIAERTLTMLFGAMDLLKLGDPWQLDTDIGPVIDAKARSSIQAYIDQHQSAILKQSPQPAGLSGHFVAPTVIQVNGIEDLTHEVFGPVLHVATYPADQLDQVIAAINAKGYGLTFGLHTRIDSRVQAVVDQLQVGNMYVNRNQIGAIVGSQPFGGEGLSGTGPKAGGPFYLQRLVRSSHPPVASTSAEEKSREPSTQQPARPQNRVTAAKATLPFAQLPALEGELAQDYAAVVQACREQLLPKQALPGPTGEDNLLSLHARGLTVIATPDAEIAFQQVLQALYCGNPVVVFQEDFTAAQRNWLQQQPASNLQVVAGRPDTDWLAEVPELATFVLTALNDEQRDQAYTYKKVLAKREGMIVRYVSEALTPFLYAQERHLCINTTAAGGNVQLIAASE